MASVAPNRWIEQLRQEPLHGAQLLAAVLIVWVAGALYCSGYERLLWGGGNWPNSLLWSAVAVLPWFALFEWSKTAHGRRHAAGLDRLALLLVSTALLSVALELATDALTGSESRTVALLLLRRLPAIGACTLLLLWSRGVRASGRRSAAEPIDEPSLRELAPSIDWIAAADNYIELHIGSRVSMRRMPLQDAERALRRRGFVRIHRRYLVNRDSVACVDQNGSGPAVRLKDGTQLSCGKAYAPRLRQLH